MHTFLSSDGSPYGALRASRASRVGCVAWLALLGACGAKTGLLVPTVTCRAAERDASCAEPAGAPFEAPVARNNVAPRSASGRWCDSATGVRGLSLPDGFCAHVFAPIRAARVLVAAPDRSLFVSSPSLPLPAGPAPGLGAIVRLTDDDNDGTAEIHRIIDEPAAHGVALSDTHLYWTRGVGGAELWRAPWRSGQTHVDPTQREQVTTLESPSASRFTRSIAVRSDGRLLVAIGGAHSPSSAVGFIQEVRRDASPRWVQGTRNPIFVRCHPTAPFCLATELGADQTTGAVDKLIEVDPCTHFGYPDCHRRAVPVEDAGTAARCASVTNELVSFAPSTTPFGFDWERGLWPEPFRGRLFVAQHGSFYAPAFSGAGVTMLDVDPCTQRPYGEARPFLQWNGAETNVVKRAADVVFAPDGRMFVSDDHAGLVFWVAPRSLRR